MINLDSTLKSRDITLPTKVHLVKAMVFPVVMYECESRTIKTAKHWRIDAFELWCWKRLLKVSWTCKDIQPVHPRGNQSWIFIGSTDFEAETPIFWPPDVKNWHSLKSPWCWERLKAGREGDNRGWNGWVASPTQWTWVWVSSGSWWWMGKSGVLQSMGSQRFGHNWATEVNWTSSYQMVIYFLKRVPEASSFSISGNAVQVVPGTLPHIHTVWPVFSLQVYSIFQWLLSCFYALEFRVRLQSASWRTLLSLLPETEI